MVVAAPKCGSSPLYLNLTYLHAFALFSLLCSSISYLYLGILVPGYGSCLRTFVEEDRTTWFFLGCTIGDGASGRNGEKLCNTEKEKEKVNLHPLNNFCYFPRPTIFFFCTSRSAGGGSVAGPAPAKSQI